MIKYAMIISNNFKLQVIDRFAVSTCCYTGDSVEKKIICIETDYSNEEALKTKTIYTVLEDRKIAKNE